MKNDCCGTIFHSSTQGGKKDKAITLEHLSGKPSYLNNIKKTLAGQVPISTLLALTGAPGLRRGVNAGSAVALGTDRRIIAGPLP